MSDMTATEPTVERLLQFHDKAMREGNMNKETGGARKIAVQEVFSAAYGDNWEQLNPLTIDIEDTLRRFENLRAMNYTPGSLQAYKSRFRSAIKEFGNWNENPSNWRPDMKTRNRVVRKSPATNGKAPDAVTTSGETETPSAIKPTASLRTANLVLYPYPLRGGEVMVSVHLPADLTKREAKRLCAFIDSLADEERPALNPGPSSE